MKKIVSIFLFLVTSILSFSEVILDSSNTKPAINEPFTIQVKFINEDKRDYEIKGIENLQILSKGTQSKYTSINGQNTKEKIDTYTVMGNEIKSFPLTVVINSTNERSNTLNIELTKERIQNSSGEMSVKSSIKTGDSFYFGQKIPYSESFLTTVQISQVGYNRAPIFNDFSEKNISPVNTTGRYPQKYFRTASGQQGIELEIYRGILQANTSGEKTIKSGHIGASKSTGRRDFFFEETLPPQYFGGGDIKINILPLPANKPVGFQNVVGTPQIFTSWNSDSIHFGESIVLNVKITGDVNLDSLEKIITKQFADFNTFESVKGGMEDIIDGKYYAEKLFEVALIPKKSGEIMTPEITIPYFDTQAKTYKNLVIPSKKINVIGNGDGNIPTAPTPTPTNTQSLNNSSQMVNTPTTNVEPLEEVKIESIANVVPTEEKGDTLVFILGALVVIEGVIIGYLLYKNGFRYKTSSELSELKNAKDDKEFYEAYCKFMKAKYNFSPKVHLEDRLVKLGLSPEFIEINRELESSHYGNTPLNRKEIYNKLRKELKI